MAIKYHLGRRIILSNEDHQRLQDLGMYPLEQTLLCIGWCNHDNSIDNFIDWAMDSYGYSNNRAVYDDNEWAEVFTDITNIYGLVSSQYKEMWGINWVEKYQLVGVDPVREGYIYSLEVL